MKIKLNWLKEHINLSLQASELAPLLTERGLEVSHLYPTIEGALDGLAIGQVCSCLPHPNADRLKHVFVDIGLSEPLSIVCGAPNIALGLKVVVARVGSTIYSYLEKTSFQIKKVKIRGITSEGMICAAQEVGLGPEADQIMVLCTDLPAGTPAKVYFKESLDEILEIDITPNRADACSHLGVARELKAILHLPTSLPSVEAFKPAPASLPLQINIENSTLCPRYCAVYIENVVIQPSPTWLQLRLQAIGIKPINNVVDTTNFILHDLGQPLHAFDYDTIIDKKLTIACVTADTLFHGLDDIERKLTGHELMISDGAGPIALAGVLGGSRTSITAGTQNVFLEGAYFDSTMVRKMAQYHGLKTDASFRFERGTDPHMPPYALKRAALLLQTLSPSAKLSGFIDIYPEEIAYRTIPFTYARTKQLLGVSIEAAAIKRILTDLEIFIEEETDQGFSAKVPPYRVDIIREVDLIEEIGRIYGYDSIPTTGHLTTAYLAAGGGMDHPYKVSYEVSKMLVANGYHEIWTNSLTKEAYNIFGQGCCDGLSVLNPMSRAANVLRGSLLFSGLEVIAYNLARRHHDLKFFELGTIYQQIDGQYQEQQQLGIWITGQIEPDNWLRKLGAMTLQSMRNSIEKITQQLGVIDLTYKPFTHPFYAVGAQALYQNKKLISFGAIDASILRYFSITQPLFFAEIHWEKLLSVGKLDQRYQPIAKVPSVKRELSLLVDKTVLFQEIKDIAIKELQAMLVALSLLDIYEGTPIPVDKKSYTIRMILQGQEKPLDDTSIEQIMHRLIAIFERDLHAIIRR